MDGFSRSLVPDNRRFTLVGYADRCDVGSGAFCLANRFFDRFNNTVPNFLRIMFNPAGFRKVLGELFCETATISRFLSKTMALEDVVP